MPAVEALIRAPGQHTGRGLRDTTIILLIFDAATRVQEILDLTPADIDTTPGRGRVTLTGKGRKTRTIPIMDNTCRHLDQYLNAFHPGTPEPDVCLASGAAFMDSLEVVCAQVFENGPVGEHVPDRRDQ
ncbi:tyrosine-type recombinase/integrase [Arthrobacter sp. MMS18-M83]|uniref:tyrosine-type recombinase/integrase n=1 Tax=Arthrobacter sp. MMS18-M83 TaxID=2996261 RepID=UPI003FA39071